jgi:MOSC domain-containing protein YiiM
MSGRLIGIARVRELGSSVEELSAATIDIESGVEGDARGRKPGRQVTVLFREGWEAACRDVNAGLSWTTRRANLYVEGMSFPKEAGWLLKIGDAVLEVSQETAPCHLMERAHEGLREAMMSDWRGGVCCRVVAGGHIRVGDTAQRLEATTRGAAH